MQVAAAVLLFVVGAWWMYNTLNKPATIAMIDKQSFSNTVVDTLSDGSIITLNKNTVLNYPASFKGKNKNSTIKRRSIF